MQDFSSVDKSKKIFFIVFLSILICVLHIFPYLLIKATYLIFPTPSVERSKLTIYFQFAQDEEHYTLELKNAFRGEYESRNRYLYEYSDASGKIPFTSATILANIGSLLGFSPLSYIIFLRIFLPLVMFFLIFILFRMLNFSSITSSVLSFIYLASPFLLYGHHNIFTRSFIEYISGKDIFNKTEIFNWYYLFSISPLNYCRLINPQFSGMFLFISIAGIFLLIKEDSKIKTKIAGALIFLLSVYIGYKIYFYVWSFIGSFSLIVFILCMVFKKWKEAIVLGIFVILGIIKVITSFKDLLISENAIEMMYSYTSSYTVILSPAVVISFVFLILFFYQRRLFKKNHSEVIVGISSLLSIIICMNQQIITGKIVQPWHYEIFFNPVFLLIGIGIFLKYTNWHNKILNKLEETLRGSYILEPFLYLLIIIFFFVGGLFLFFNYFLTIKHLNYPMIRFAIFAFILLFETISLYLFLFGLSRADRQFTPVFKRFLIFIIAISLFEGLAQQTAITQIAEKNYNKVMPYAAAFEWLNNNARYNSVVLADLIISEQIPIYTNCKVYLCKNAYHYSVPDIEERRTRLFTYTVIAGLDEKAFFEKVDKFWLFSYMLWGTRTEKPMQDLYTFGRQKLITPAEKKEIVEKYNEIYNKNFADLIKQYKLDYILYGPEEKKFFTATPNTNFWEIVFRNKDLIIYKLKL